MIQKIYFLVEERKLLRKYNLRKKNDINQISMYINV